MRHVSEQHNGVGARKASTRSRWIFATLMFAIGVVPVTEIAMAAGTSSAAACPGATYSVVSGDSWSRIASRVKVTMSSLMNANAATAATVIHPGQTLCLPSGTLAATTATTVPTTTATIPTAAPAASVTVSMPAFPVQGPCSFVDTYGAPRGTVRGHEGVDIIAKSGQWVYAVIDGTLTKQYHNAPGSLSGNGWRLTAAGGTYFFYAHLSAFAPGLSVGSAVKAGQIIGQVGMTGNAPIPHLHFEIHPGGGASINPTATVKAVDGCKVTAVPPQPNGVVPAAPTTTVPVVVVPAPTVAEPTTTTVYIPPPVHRRDVVIVSGPTPRRITPPGSGG